MGPKGNLPNVHVELTYINSYQVKNAISKEIKFEYYWLDDIKEPNPNLIVSLENFKRIFKKEGTNQRDYEKMAYLKNRYVTDKGRLTINNKKVAYVVYFASSADSNEKQSEQADLINSKDRTIVKVEPNYVKIQNGVTLSVKGMPTGIEISTDQLKGALGYARRMFMLIEDAGVNFDIGRKTISSGPTLKRYKEVASDEYRKYLDNVMPWVKDERARVPQNETKDVTFNKLRECPKMMYAENTDFIIKPRQEESVTGIFFEQLGKGKFPGVAVYEHGYANIYDLYFAFQDGDKVIEFKQRIASFLKNLSANNKNWNEIDYLVMFELKDKDKQDLQKKHIIIESVKPTINNLHATYTLYRGNDIRTIQLIELKNIISMKI
ncbi:hypothetical protein [Secundilactobacillus collinoides]|nr:hypothetical protein [Secundilactobacillus collinoides]